MQSLNYPEFTFRLKKQAGQIHIFDIIRRKYVVLTPEEWVRQHSLHYLIFNKNYPKNLMAVEKQLNINNTKRRFDIVVFNKAMIPEILVECKAPHIPIDQKTFDQINQYNWQLQAPYLFLTNGIKHIYCQVNFEQNNFTFLKDLPYYRP